VAADAVAVTLPAHTVPGTQLALEAGNMKGEGAGEGSSEAEGEGNGEAEEEGDGMGTNDVGASESPVPSDVELADEGKHPAPIGFLSW
jgi:hypothetical protein